MKSNDEVVKKPLTFDATNRMTASVGNCGRYSEECDLRIQWSGTQNGAEHLYRNDA